MKNPKKHSRIEIQEEIEKIFSQKNPSPQDIKKAKQLAMSKNIKLKEFKKRFCKKCFSFFTTENTSVRIKNNHKTITCKNCGYVTRYNLQ